MRGPSLIFTGLRRYHQIFPYLLGKKSTTNPKFGPKASRGKRQKPVLGYRAEEIKLIFMLLKNHPERNQIPVIY